jgi:hypothetical protein
LASKNEAVFKVVSIWDNTPRSGARNESPVSHKTPTSKVVEVFDMSKLLAITMAVLTVLAFGVVAVTSVALVAEPVAADNCGGPNQPSCGDYCTWYPDAVECRKPVQ